VTELERYFREKVGLYFHNSALLQQALTHRSYVNEHPVPPEVPKTELDNERLEFLGDAVLDIIVAEWLFRQLPLTREGKLTRLRSALVSTEALAELSMQLGFGQWLRLGRGEEEHGGRERQRTLAGTFEAVCGALYLEQGVDTVRAFALPLLKPHLDQILAEASDKDAKSRLQEWAHVTLNQTPTYHILEVVGPEHARTFTVEVRLEDRVVGTGNGSSKHRAEHTAAREALKALAAG